MALTADNEAPKSSIGARFRTGVLALGLALPASQAFADTNNAALDALAGRFGEKGAVVDASRSARGKILYADSGVIITDAVANPEGNSAYIRKIHAEAIQMGENEYVQLSLLYNPDFQAGGYYEDETPEGKEREARAEFQEFFGDFLKGEVATVDIIVNIARYAPIFSTEYLMQFEGDFPTEELAGAIKIVELDIKIAESQAELAQEQAELAQEQAELAQEQEKLREAFGKLAETMKSKGIGA